MTRIIVVEGGREHFFDALDQNEGQVVAHFLRDILQIFLIGLRQNDPLDAGAMGSQYLFFDSADRKDQSAEADLTGHRGIATDGPSFV